MSQFSAGTMATYSQRGGCLCGDVAYELTDIPLTLYACHCSECQRQTGASFALSMAVKETTLRLTRGVLQQYSLPMSDGRLKQAHFCGRCATRLWNSSRIAGIVVVEPGTLDDTSWLRPVAHIWTSSAQPWFAIPEDALVFSQQPRREDYAAMVRAWSKIKPCS